MTQREQMEILIAQIERSLGTAKEIYNAIPVETHDLFLKPGDDINGAIKTLTEGGTIHCLPGSYGPLILQDFPHKMITIQTKSFERMHPRAVPEDAPNMAIFSTMIGKNKSNSFMFRDVAFDTTNTYNQILIGGNKNDMPTPDLIPHTSSFDYTLHLGNTNTKRGILANCKFFRIENSFLDDFAWKGEDSQAIAASNGAFAHVIRNCGIGAASENILYGGDDAALLEMYPGDVKIESCEIFKKREWVGTNVNVKALVESKNCLGLEITDCDIHGCWKDSWAFGVAVIFKAANQSGGNPQAQTSNVKFFNNRVFDVGCYLIIGGRNDAGRPSGVCTNLWIANNRWFDMHTEGDGRAIKVGDSPRDVLIDHNTIEENRHSFLETWNYEEFTGMMSNNAMRHGTYGYHPAIPPGVSIMNNGVEENPNRKMPLNATNKWFPPASFSTLINSEGETTGALAEVPTTDGKRLGYIKP